MSPTSLRNAFFGKEVLWPYETFLPVGHQHERTCWFRELYIRMTRNLREAGLEEGASTRLLVNAAKLIDGGISPSTATNTAVALPLTDDSEMLMALSELSRTIF